MSSTKRGKRGRRVSDYYATPVDEIVRFLEEFETHIDVTAPILDPCAGGDKLHEMSYPVALQRIGIPMRDICTLDIRKDSPAEYTGDYLKWKPPVTPNLIITNPPFLHAREIIEKALEDVADGGWVVMLLRLNFFGSASRFPFWKKHMPLFAFVHHKRMSFTDDGKTDSIEYMHAVWQRGSSPESTVLKVL